MYNFQSLYSNLSKSQKDCLDKEIRKKCVLTSAQYRHRKKGRTQFKPLERQKINQILKRYV
jgi:hypothetical protein